MTGREEPSAEVLLERLVSREAHIRRGLPRVGQLGAVLGKKPSCAILLLLQHCLTHCLCPEQMLPRMDSAR